MTFGTRVWGPSFRTELTLRQFRRALAIGSRTA